MKIDIKLEYCYGIKKFDFQFDFTQTESIAIYAPNGVMKTSLARTIKDQTTGTDPRDLRYPKRPSTRTIKNDTGRELGSQDIFVIESYDTKRAEWNWQKVSTLLVNETLKKQFDSIYNEIEASKLILNKKLKKLSSCKLESIDTELAAVSDHKTEDTMTLLEKQKQVIQDKTPPQFVGVVYTTVFNDKVNEFLSKEENLKQISDYIKRYNDLVKNSIYFKLGVFDHYGAKQVGKTLTDKGYFEASHQLVLDPSGTNKQISSQDELDQLIEDEISKILGDEQLVQTFKKIDDQLNKTIGLSDFKQHITLNPKILLELNDLEKFKQKLWISYLKESEEEYTDWLNRYQAGKGTLKTIADTAKEQTKLWGKVIDEFNDRFDVPFKVLIANQDDVILKDEIPIVKFHVEDESDERDMDDAELLKTLSSGETKALYLLNIIFEIKSREESGQSTLFVIDDIADSFDYRNKYAIIEYLSDIAEFEHFKQLILTHNFDFFRTIQSRLNLNESHCLMVEKAPDEVKMVVAEYINDPFGGDWIDHLTDDKKLVASIPFVRNIAQYLGRGTDFSTLTSLLHDKTDSDTILKGSIETMYQDIFDSSRTISVTDPTKKITDLIFELAESCLGDPEGVNLENKIILSIATRLSAEKFMKAKITDQTAVAAITSYQTRTLFNLYSTEFASTEEANMRILKRVNLITPANIHFNSFMYEPILDLGEGHLRQLYKDVRDKLV